MARTLINSVDITPATTAQVGDVVQSMLTEAQFQAIRGTDWVLADGRTAAGTEYNSITGNANIPDMRGQFLRGKDHGRHAIDGNGNPDGDVALGTYTGDAIRNMTGRTYTFSGGSTTRPDSGIFDHTNAGNAVIEYSPNRNFSTNYVDFNASRQVPTAADNRPKNVTVNIFIKIN